MDLFGAANDMFVSNRDCGGAYCVDLNFEPFLVLAKLDIAGVAYFVEGW